MTFLVLDTVDKNLLLSLLEATVTTEPVFTSHYYDSLEANIEEKSFDGVMNGVSYVVAVDAPASTIKRITKEITVYNSDSIDHTFILSLNNTGDKRIISTFTLLAGRSASLSTEGYRGERGYQGFQGGVGSQGNQGAQGIQGSQGYQGYQGFQGNQGTQGNQGSEGESAYDIWLSLGNTGTEQDFLDWINDTAGIAFNTIGRIITDATATLARTDNNKYLQCNRATAITITIPLATLQVGDIISFEQAGAGVVTLAVADAAKQYIPTANKTWGQSTVIQLICKDDTVDAEKYNILGGV